MMFSKVALFLLGAALSGVVANDTEDPPFVCTLCPGGESPPDPAYVPFQPGITCRALEAEARAADEEDCPDFQGFAAATCYCESFVPDPESLCTGLCPDGSAPPEAFAIVGDPPGLSVGDLTCSQFNGFFALGDTDEDSCAMANNVGVALCGCTETRPEPNCTVCQDGTFPPNVFTGLGDDIDCGFLSGVLRSEANATACDAIQQFAGPYCGCESQIEDDSACRLCGDRLLPDPTRELDDDDLERDCGTLELEANLDKSICMDYQSDYAAQCCSITCTLCPGGEDVPDPLFEPFGPGYTCGDMEEEASLTTDADKCSQYHLSQAGNCGCPSFVPDPNAVCQTICPDGSSVPNQDGIIDNSNFTCRQLEAQAATGLNSEATCNSAFDIGVYRCGCDETRPEPNCKVCQDVDFPPIGGPGIGINDTACGLWGGIIRDADADTCAVYQHVLGPVCGCENTALPNACGLCEGNLPEPSRWVFGVARDCGTLELEANLDPTLCQNYRDDYSESCCDVASTIPPTVSGPTCTICPGGEAVPDPLFEPFEPGYTCGDIEEEAAEYSADADECMQFQLFQAGNCGCPSFVPRANVSCVALCPDGSEVPNPEGVVDNTNPDAGFNPTCLQLQAQAASGLGSEATCNSAFDVGVHRCGCTETRPEPNCTVCQDVPFPPFTSPLINDTACGFWGGIIRDADPETCAVYQDVLGPACGCNNTALLDPCRLCEDMMLPEPSRWLMSEGRDCGTLEIEANLDSSLCRDYSNEFSDFCCGAGVPAQPAFSPNAAPVEPSSAPSAPTTPLVSCETVCPDGSSVSMPDTIAFTQAGVQFTCGQLDELVASDSSLISLECDVLNYIGVSACGCENILPEPSCHLCEDGSPPPDLTLVIDERAGTCAHIAVNVIPDLNEADCKFYQSTAGVYCGCNNPVASEGACRICGGDNLLPDPSVIPEASPDKTCVGHEFEAATLDFDCESYQQGYGTACCMTMSPTTTPPTTSTANETDAPGPSPTTLSPKPTPGSAASSLTAVVSIVVSCLCLTLHIFG